MHERLRGEVIFQNLFSHLWADCNALAVSLSKLKMQKYENFKNTIALIYSNIQSVT